MPLSDYAKAKELELRPVYDVTPTLRRRGALPRSDRSRKHRSKSRFVAVRVPSSSAPATEIARPRSGMVCRLVCAQGRTNRVWRVGCCGLLGTSSASICIVHRWICAGSSTGLPILARDVIQHDPLSGTMFAFINARWDQASFRTPVFSVIVEYRWHPLRGRRVPLFRRIGRGVDEVVHLDAPPGMSRECPAWMCDPAHCRAMVLGDPQLSVQALALIAPLAELPLEALGRDEIPPRRSLR